MKLLVFGASGMIGSEVMDLATADSRITMIIAPARQPLPPRPKLVSPAIDFDHPPEDAEWWQADAVICALGTTRQAAGSKEAFYKVDHDYPMMAGRLSRQHGTPTYVLNSAKGANAHSMFFYNRTKGTLERDLAALGFPSLTFVQPALLSGNRKESRPTEALEIKLVTAFAPIIPRGYRVNPAEKVAQALLDAALNPRPGTHVVSSDSLV